LKYEFKGQHKNGAAIRKKQLPQTEVSFFQVSICTKKVLNQIIKNQFSMLFLVKALLMESFNCKLMKRNNAEQG